MLDINLIRNEPETVRAMLRDRQNPELAPVVDDIATADARRRELLKEVETLKADRNAASKAISRLKDPAEREARIAEQKGMGERIAGLDDEVRTVDAQLQGLLARLPNLPDPRTPPGLTEDDNVVLRNAGQPREFDFTPLPHWDLGPRLGIIDFERGVKLSGSRFYVLSGAGARLQRALIAWMLDLHTRGQGYTEVYTPFMVREEIMFGGGPTAQVLRQSVPRRGGRPLHGADGRGAGHRPAQGRDSRRGRSAAPLQRLHAMLPAREDRRRPRRARHQARPPIRQGGDVYLLPAG